MAPQEHLDIYIYTIFFECRSSILIPSKAILLWRFVHAEPSSKSLFKESTVGCKMARPSWFTNLGEKAHVFYHQQVQSGHLLIWTNIDCLWGKAQWEEEWSNPHPALVAKAGAGQGCQEHGWKLAEAACQ